jgi:diguanylate cyclase (GGDEF)-like protein
VTCDELGHATGDRLLVEVAQRLRQCVRAGDTISRLGGDEFVLLLSQLDDEQECDRAVTRVLTSLATPFHMAGRNIEISASIGVTLFPLDGSDADTLMRHADQAMYLAKQLTPRILPEIGRRFGGRDHTTIMHGVRRIEELMTTDSQMADDLQLLRRQLEG